MAPARELCGRCFDSVLRAELGALKASFRDAEHGEPIQVEVVQSADAGISGVVYDCSLVLAQYLVEHGELDLERKQVVELGCGAGLAILTAARLGAQRAVGTDASERALELLRASAKATGVQVDAVPFKWAETPAPCDPADVLLLADVCYREDAVGPLLKAVDACLSAQGVALAVLKLRSVEVRSCIETFLRGLRERGFCIRGLPLHTEPLVSICDPAGKDIPPPSLHGIQGFEIRRGAQ